MATTSAPPKLDPNDFLDLDHLLGDEERLLRDTVRRSSATASCPTSPSWFEEGTFPRELAKEMGALGLLGMHLEGYGCAGTSASAYGLACLELEAGDSGARCFVSVQGSLAMFPIWKFGSRGAEAGVAAADGGGRGDRLLRPDRARLRLRPVGHAHDAPSRDGDDWVLNGTKMWITNGGVADVAVVWAQHRRRHPRLRRAHRHPGLHRPRHPPEAVAARVGHLRARRSTTCACPADAVLPEVTSMRGPLVVPERGPLRDLLGRHRRRRAPATRRRSSTPRRACSSASRSPRFQLTQRKLVDMMLELQKAQLLAWHLGRLKDAGTLDPRQVSFGKLNNVREALAIAREARTILGANGITTRVSRSCATPTTSSPSSPTRAPPRSTR